MYFICLHHFLKINMKLSSVSCLGAWLGDMHGDPAGHGSHINAAVGFPAGPTVPKNLDLLDIPSDFIQGIA